MHVWKASVFFIIFALIAECRCQQYDFGAEISRQCLVPDPVGLLDCVENKVTLPYLSSWVECTNSLGENVQTSADIINYRCKSVWEGKGVIPEVFYIKDCVIEKTGLPAKNVSAEVLGAYKECEATPNASAQLQQAPLSQNRIKTAPIQGSIYNSPFQRLTSPPVLQQTLTPGRQSNPPTQEYDFAAEISRQCLVPDPVGLLDCVENKVKLPYLTSWVDCTNGLGQNVKTSADIINYRCKSVWEGKGVIPEVFYIKDCVIEKTGLPAKNVSAEVLGAYKECEATLNSSRKQTQAPIRTVPIQQVQVNEPSQEYDFAAEISRQCLVPDPVGLLDCVENKVTLPYLSSWVECTNSLGQNVKTSADIINYRCKSVWEGKGVIPEVFYIKDCVIAKTGLPAKRVSAEVLGAYKECEASPDSLRLQTAKKPPTQTSIKAAPAQQQIKEPIQQQQQVTQEYDFAAEISRQCLVPNPVGLLDCVENKVTLPYLSSWVECTNSLGQNVKTSADIINYRCKSVWEGKGVMPEVFYIKDCVIAKTGLPAKRVSAEVLGAYKECEATSDFLRLKTQEKPPVQTTIKTVPVQQQQLNAPSQEYDFAAEISRQCRVPDPVGLLDCVENKVNLPYLSSWVECTNSLGQNVKTSADIINYRCKSVWEGKGVIPEVFYIKDCVIAKTGLPAKRVSAEVLGAYKECEATPNASSQKSILQSKKTTSQAQQQTNTPYQQQPPRNAIQMTNTAVGYGQRLQPPNAPLPPRQRPFSQQYFILYPRPPPFSADIPKPIAQQEVNVPFINQQQIPVSSYMPQMQQPALQQGIKTAPVPSMQMTGTPALPLQPQLPYFAIPNGAYYYGFQIKH